jgi:peroxiredoxin
MARITPRVERPTDFTLHATPDQTVSLTDFRGHPVVLAFHPADWSPVCGDQMALYNEVLPEVRRHQATLLGISVEGAWCQAAFAQLLRGWCAGCSHSRPSTRPARGIS